MEYLAERHSFEVADEALLFTYIRLRSKEESKAFAEEVKQIRERLAQSHRVWKEKQIERRALGAEIEVLDDSLDREMSGLSITVAGSQPERHASSVWQTLFPKPPSKAMTSIGGEDQELYVLAVLQRLEAPEYAAFQSYASAIRQRLEALQAAQAQRQAARLEEDKAKTAYLAVFAETRDFYNQLHPRLRLELGWSKHRTESFFTALQRRKKAASSPSETPNSDPQDD